MRSKIKELSIGLAFAQQRIKHCLVLTVYILTGGMKSLCGQKKV